MSDIERATLATSVAFENADNWQALNVALEGTGWKLEAKGRGLIFTDGSNETKMSAINRGFSRSALEARFGQPFNAPSMDGHFVTIVEAKKNAL